MKITVYIKKQRDKQKQPKNQFGIQVKKKK